ncbi:MAG: NAD(P)H-hydrate dehydratase [Clostridia bacterium]|nr:NAD(P)H-hydrate dehydratase [Clostridia bacterium]
MLIGIDIAQISRFENIGEAFIKKCFNEDEIALFTGVKAAERIAANFAAKEAFAKALGTGVRGFELRDISVLRDNLGKPYFKFADNVSAILLRLGAKKVELTLSHDGGMAIAAVAIECSDKVKNFSFLIDKTRTDDKNIISYKTVKSSILPRESNTHKGDYGKIFIVAGSKGLTGAAIMASKAALKSGGGLITLGCPDSLNSIFEISLHEVMTYPLADNGIYLLKDCAGDIIEKANKSSVLAFGCGLSNTKDVRSILKRVLHEVEVPVVIDADGLNALSRNINILKTAKPPVVLTPHIAEFARLSGYAVEDINADREKFAKEFAVKWGVTLVLKSEKTLVADEYGNIYANLLGNAGMATGGSGDVLAGIIASFIGQGIENAVQCGVYIHSLAGDMAAQDKGEYGMTPADIIENIPYAIDLICGKD